MVEARSGEEGNHRNAMRLVISTLKSKLTVYGRDGKNLGSVEQFVTAMHTGKTEYAVLSFGGFLGIGQKYHPVPFSYLRLSTDGAGYILDVDKALVDGSPSYRNDDAPIFDEGYGERITSYYVATTSAS